MLKDTRLTPFRRKPRRRLIPNQRTRIMLFSIKIRRIQNIVLKCFILGEGGAGWCWGW